MEIKDLNIPEIENFQEREHEGVTKAVITVYFLSKAGNDHL